MIFALKLDIHLTYSTGRRLHFILFHPPPDGILITNVGADRAALVSVAISPYFDIDARD